MKFVLLKDVNPVLLSKDIIFSALSLSYCPGKRTINANKTVSCTCAPSFQR